MAGFADFDLAVAAVYVLALALLAIVSRLKIRTLNQQFLGAQQARWPMVGFALFAATISSTALVGVSGSAYAHGLSVYNYDWVATFVLVAFCAVVLPTYLASGVFTVPEFLEKRYGRFARTYVSGLAIVLFVLVDTVGALFAGSVLFKLLFPALTLWQVSALLSLCAAGFLLIGGLRAVMITDTVQALILIGSCMVLSVTALTLVGGWEALTAQIDPAKLRLVRPADDAVLPWTGLITGLPLIGFYFWCTNQYMVQKVLAAKSLDHGRWGSLFAGGLKLSTLFLLIVPALCALVILPGLERPESVFWAMIVKLLPTGLIGLVIGAFIVSLMSSLAATYNAAATLVTLDFIKRYRPHTSERWLLNAGRVAILSVMGISMLWLPVMSRIQDTLWEYLQAMLSYAVPPVAALFLLGIFWKRANRFGAGCGLVIGSALSIGLFLGGEIFDLIPLHFLEAAFVIFAASALSLVAGSYLRPAPDWNNISGLMFTRAVWQRETAQLRTMPIYKNYRYLSLGLLVLTLVVVSPFL